MTRVGVYFLGGTISMAAAAGGGVAAALGPADLLAALPVPSELGVQLEPHDVSRRPSAALRPSDVLEVCRTALASGADGVVVVQGTDTIEETAFLFDLLWSGAAPLVVTGAMRNPTVPGADGAANLLAAISVAAGAEFRDQGALVVLDDEVHAARYVGKWHTTATGAFVSANGGPLGRVDEGRPRRYTRVDRVPSWPLPPALDHRVPLIVSVLGDDGLLLDTLAADPARVDGVVLAGLGGGHVPGWLADRVGGLAARVPVVLTSRTGAGPVLTRTYAATGAEIDLIGRGVLPGGLLDPFKARLLLLVTLACGLDRAGIAAAISAYG